MIWIWAGVWQILFPLCAVCTSQDRLRISYFLVIITTQWHCANSRQGKPGHVSKHDMGRGETFNLKLTWYMVRNEEYLSRKWLLDCGCRLPACIHQPPGHPAPGSPLANLTRVWMLAPSADPGVKKINWTLFSATLSLTTSYESWLGPRLSAIRDHRLCPHWNLPIMITPGPRDIPDWFRFRTKLM